MPELKEMIEAIGRTFEEFKAANDLRIKELEKGKSDPVLAEKVDKINTALTQMGDMKQQLEAIETAVARSQFHGGGEINPAKAAHKKAFNAWLRKGNDDGLRDMEVKAELSTLSDPDGGYTVPEELNKNIRDIAVTMSAMRRLADVITIGTSEYKELVDMQGESAEWVGEKGTRSETDTPTLAMVSWFPKELSAMPPVTQNMLDDSWFDVEAWVSKFIARAMSVKEGVAWINGNGVEKPKGIAGYTMIADASYAWGKVGYLTSGNANLLNNPDKIEDVSLALKAMYLNGASWLTNRATVGKIRQLKDGDGKSLWQPGLQVGAPNMLFGYPVELDDNIDNIGANKYPLWFGNFKEAYLIVDRQGVRMLRDPFTKKPYVLFYTTKRTGGGIRNFEAIKALKISA